MVELLGAVVKDRRILHIQELDEGLMEAMAQGYVEGFNLARESHQSADMILEWRQETLSNTQLSYLIEGG